MSRIHHLSSFARSALATLLCLLAVTTTAAGAASAQRPSRTPGLPPRIALLREFRPIGGFANNLRNRTFNPVPGSPELNIAPLNFAASGNDGLIPGPNPRTISNLIAGGTGAGGNNGETDDPTLSAWLYVFGQFLDHDIDLESTPPTNPAINIVVPTGDPVFPEGTSIAMTRATRSPQTNTIVNEVPTLLDLSQLYGESPSAAAALMNPDGTLKSTGYGLYLPVQNGVFVAGDPRVMENPELTALTTLFMREHNYWVHALRRYNRSWTPSQLYNMARSITIAEYQNVIYSEYLPHLIGPVLGPYRGYAPWVNPQVTQEFSTAAFRVGHSQVSDTQEGLSSTGAVLFTEPLAQAFFNTAAIDIANGIDPLLRSLGADYAQATDVYSVSTLRNLLFAPLPGGDVDKIDLIAIDIQRERDVGLGSLNQTRVALHMQPYRSFAQLTPDPVLQAALQSVYANPDAVDLFVGGLAEPHARGAAVGPTFQAIIADQFGRLRAGDRFYWQNEGFDPQTAAMISRTTLATILARDSTVTDARGDLFVEAAIPGHVKKHVKVLVP